MENLEKIFRIFLVRELSLKLPCLFHGQSRIQIRKETERKTCLHLLVFQYSVQCTLYTVMYIPGSR